MSYNPINIIIKVVMKEFNITVKYRLFFVVTQYQLSGTI